MRIITVEEHIFDPVIERATHAALAAEAGYLADLGASVALRDDAARARPPLVPAPAH